ncbi:DUF2778 domain-containing protein [Methylocapsa acidiphila]|uniref:DUF2778 domain-containing protein n=1 Tax=Methylocapsa acidiphila TaxID=133552 RepID=UPI00068478B0|nr:DUF2778 domain-containing protein [Methylocapsa acidiphila]
MTHWLESPQDLPAPRRTSVALTVLSRIVPGAVTLGLTMMFGVWTLYLRDDVPRVSEAQSIATPPTTEVAALTSTPTAETPRAANPYGALFDPRGLPNSEAASLTKNFPVAANDAQPATPAAAQPVVEAEAATPSSLQSNANVPMPVPRPVELAALDTRNPIPAASRRVAQQNNKTSIAVSPPADNRSFFEKLFSPAQPSGPVLAYAAPETNMVLGAAKASTTANAPRLGGGTAIYDISAHTVYLPNGARLEAHSGLGDRLDNPHFVHERMRGPTPPSVYELKLREAPFHGVRALRLTPVGNSSVYGRTGLLAHTYMLGPNGDSNGCVSFRNYNAFLQAYESGEVRRLAVVTHMN